MRKSHIRNDSHYVGTVSHGDTPAGMPHELPNKVWTGFAVYRIIVRQKLLSAILIHETNFGRETTDYPFIIPRMEIQ